MVKVLNGKKLYTAVSIMILAMTFLKKIKAQQISKSEKKAENLGSFLMLILLDCAFQFFIFIFLLK